MTKAKIVCSMGGGFTSSALMPRLLLEEFDKDQIEFINCVLPNEHPDTWRLFDAVEETLGINITYIAYAENGSWPGTWQLVKKQDRANRELLTTPFDIFLREGFIATSRNDLCSFYLKRETIAKYVSENYSTSEAILAIGIHADEYERSVSIRLNWQKRGYKTVFPILNERKLSREEEIAKMKEWYGVTLELYDLGFDHNNCGGACVKAGQRQWARLWFYQPNVYAEWERLELEWGRQWAEERGKQYTILKILRSGVTKFITLKEFRETILEPAWENKNDTLIGKFLAKLPGNPACMWCSAI